MKWDLFPLITLRIISNTGDKKLSQVLEGVSQEAYASPFLPWSTVGDKLFGACLKKNRYLKIIMLLVSWNNHLIVLSCLVSLVLCLSAFLPLTFLFVSFLLLKTVALWFKIFLCVFCTMISTKWSWLNPMVIVMVIITATWTYAFSSSQDKP